MSTSFDDLFDELDMPSDLSLSEGEGVVSGGDLYADETRDLAVIGGIANVDLALRRRLNTPKGALASLVVDVDGLKLVDEDEGNGAFRFLSEPINNQTISGMREAIAACVAQEPLVQLDALTTRVVPDDGDVHILYDIQYTVIATGQTGAIGFARGPDGFSFL